MDYIYIFLTNIAAIILLILLEKIKILNKHMFLYNSLIFITIVTLSTSIESKTLRIINIPILIIVTLITDHFLNKPKRK
ncbi:hypothetical protein [Dethiothermospora halolimnae]|uniref:hypothetical protein n=1 Tax=Dethiothermospora halolimnae TaxID=3114390 RepID=UPI003CCBE790